MPPLVPEAIHPLLVHFPLVLLPLAAAFITFQRRLPWSVAALPVLLCVAAVGAVLAVLAGLSEAAPYAEKLQGTSKEQWLSNHRLLGLTTAALAVSLAVAAIVTRRAPWTPRRNLVWAAALWGAAALVALTAWYGGAMVYEP